MLQGSYNAPSVSIIVPIYNVEIYLEQCVESLIGQTLSNIEILLVDDGSTDGSGALADKLALRDPRIRVFHKPNGGLSDARNYAIPLSRAPYIGFVDSDDWVDPTMFEKLYMKAVLRDAECVVCDALTHNMATGELDHINIRAPESDFGNSVSKKPILIYAAHSYAWNKLYHRKLFDDPRLHFPVGQHFEDSAVVYNLMAAANLVECVNEPLYHYRSSRPGAITSAVSPKVFDIFLSCNSILSYFRSRGLIRGSEMPYVLERIIRNHIVARFNLLLKSNDRVLATKYIYRAFRYLDTKFPGWRKRYTPPASKKNSWLWLSRVNPALAYARIWAPKSLFTIAEKIHNIGFNKKKNVTPVPDDKLRDLQLELLAVLDDFHTMCESRGLGYYLSEGTLLGAIRHNAMIPWDDDIDVAMQRNDYDKLMAIPAEEWPESIRLWSQKTDPRYPLPFAKVVRTAPSDFRNAWPNDTAPEFNGPFIDVFPLDKATKHTASGRTKSQLDIRKWRDILLIKRGYRMRKINKHRLQMLIAPFMSFERLHANLYRAFTGRKRNVYAVYLTNLASSYLPSKQTVPREWYGRPVMVMFEGKERPCPSNSPAILKQIYGDYMQLPPLWKRGRSTHFMSYEPRTISRIDAGTTQAAEEMTT